jgi:putative membrane protein
MTVFDVVGRTIHPSSVIAMRPPMTRTILRTLLATGIFSGAAVFASLHAGSLDATPAPARVVALDDPTIVAIFDAANTWDIETGALAEKKGTTKDIRDFGAMLVHDHTMVRQQGRDLAKKLGVHPTPPKDFAMAKDHEQAMRTLRAAKGKEFDRAFLQNEVAFHKAVIDAVTQTLLPAIQNQDLKNLVTRVAPAFQAHMAAAQQKLDALNSVAGAK